MREGRGLSMEEDRMMMGYMNVRKPDEKTPIYTLLSPCTIHRLGTLTRKIL